jgi:hypothetical protein
MKIFIIVIIFGFPVALIFSWAFEITPEGIKLESEIEPNKSIARRTRRKTELDYEHDQKRTPSELNVERCTFSPSATYALS